MTICSMTGLRPHTKAFACWPGRSGIQSTWPSPLEQSRGFNPRKDAAGFVGPRYCSMIVNNGDPQTLQQLYCVGTLKNSQLGQTAVG